MVSSTRYHQFCPVAKALEALGERWSLLIVRELLAGPHRFNDLKRGLPRMSPALLSKRLKDLESVGVLAHAESLYSLTPAGEELGSVVKSLGQWGSKWAQQKIASEDLDADLLIRSLSLTIDAALFPAGRTVAEFDLGAGARKKRLWWIVIEDGAAYACRSYPGFEPDVRIQANIRLLTEIFMNKVPLSRALQSGRLQVHGDKRLVKTFPQWFGRNPYDSGVQAAG